MNIYVENAGNIQAKYKIKKTKHTHTNTSYSVEKTIWKIDILLSMV